jgi:hypothetical protein
VFCICRHAGPADPVAAAAGSGICAGNRTTIDYSAFDALGHAARGDELIEGLGAGASSCRSTGPRRSPPIWDSNFVAGAAAELVSSRQFAPRKS